MICRECGAPIRFVREAGGYLHTEPLALMRVSHYEAADVMAAPPDRFKQRGNARSLLHPATPERRF